MGEDNSRFDFANDGGDLAQQLQRVKNFQIVHQAGMILRPENPRPLARLRLPHRAGGGAVELDGSAVAAGQAEVVSLVAGALQQQERSGHVEFDVVGVRPDCDGGRSGHTSGHFNSDNLTGRPSRADRSAANTASCVGTASARLVNGISRPFASARKNASNCVW